MQGRNSVYESSRSAECPRLGRANILPDRCRWWWGSEGRAPPEKNDSNHFIVNALNVEIIDDEIAARDEKKRKRNDISADIRIATARFYVLPPWIRGDRTRSETRLVYPYTRGATRYRSSVDKMSDTSGLKRSDSPHKPNVDSRKIVLSLFTAQPSSIVSLKSCNVLLLSIPLYIPV